MAQKLLVLLVALMFGAVFLLPQPRPARQLALQLGTLLVEDSLVPDGGGDQSLFEIIRASDAFGEDDEGNLQFRLNGVSIKGDENAQADITDNLPARKSLARGLRTLSYKGKNNDDGDVIVPSRELQVLAELTPRVELGGGNFEVELSGSEVIVRYTIDEGGIPTNVTARGQFHSPGRNSLLPPIIAVAFAILLRKPLLALFSGVLVGAMLVRYAMGASALAAIGGGTKEVFSKYLYDQVTAEDRMLTISFVFFMLAMVGVMTRAGGIQGLMDRIARLAHNARKTQIATYLMGLAIFFDDYANTILVGSTMRNLSDRYRIAREKLAYLVDSTAAPVAGLSVFSTWIAFEVSTYSAQLPTAGLSAEQGYSVFFRTIPYSFYCVLTIAFVGFVAFTGRDFGPMLDAERRARRTGKLVAEGSTPMVGEESTSLEVAENVTPKAWRALVPLATFLFVTLFSIFKAGGAFEMGAKLFSLEGFVQVLYDGSGSWPLFYGSLAGFLVASFGAVTAGAGNQILSASWKTVRSMWVAFAILYLAWMIGAVCSDLGTAPYLTSLVDGILDANLLPTVVFILAGLVALATGSSWSTMSILLPLVVPLAFALGEPAGLAATPVESGQLLMVICIAAVLSGSIFGDHCSPISDTTVLSSISSASDHIDHVRTQAPYAVVVATIAILTGYLPATYAGLSPWISLALGVLLSGAVVFGLGRRADDAVPIDIKDA
ncbi:MAG: Na+/H+ antiporter NhaC [Planctomycetota bacterium]|jgi:Na+/H+ antiporter NhaC